MPSHGAGGLVPVIAPQGIQREKPRRSERFADKGQGRGSHVILAQGLLPFSRNVEVHQGGGDT